jgi:DNA-binding CsgD family transcriptional regulator
MLGHLHADAALGHRLILEHIRLLCRCGVGLEAIAGPLCKAVRARIKAMGVALFWLDDAGAPSGFFHDCAPAELKDLFVTRFEELFVDPNEISMLTFIRGRGPPIGTTLADGFMDRFRQENIYRYLCAPLGHYHMLDVRIDLAGEGRAALCAWNEQARPFTQREVALLAPVKRLMDIALSSAGANIAWHSSGQGHGHFITDIAGKALIAIDAEAEAFLLEAHLLMQNVPMQGEMRAPPTFARMLAAQLAERDSAEIRIPIANGRLVARASRTRIIEGAGSDQAMMHVALGRETPRNVIAVEHVMALPLTPLQREIALFGMTGGARGDCGAEFGVSREALKKHLRAIYSATGTERWVDLAAIQPAA